MIMQCTMCGATLSQETTICPQCHTPVSTSHAAASSYETGEDSIPYIAYGASREITPASPPEVNAQSSPPQTEDGLKTPVGSQFIAPDSQAQQANVGVQPRRALPVGIVVLLIVLALLVIISGSGFTYYIVVLRPAEFNAQATAVVQTVLTTEARHATATASALSPQDLYSQAISGSPVLNDSLSSANTSGTDWPENSGQVGSCTYAGGAYHIKVLQTSFFAPCMSTSRSLSNFAFQVQLAINGDGGGIIFRDSTSTTNDIRGYFFAISSVGQFALIIRQGASQSQTLQQGFSPAVNTGPNQPNLLTVIARSNTLYLYINRQFITSAKDEHYSSGGIALYAFNAGHLTDVAFSNAQVWNLP
jgi:mRNA-degrading endonuclease toxin of MazEF toxin-antitoxin module